MKLPNLIHILIGIVCFALLPRVQAVVPPPPGGYGTNTAAGTQALQSLTDGVWNTALGYQALFNNTTGSSNTATGLWSLLSNVNGANNTATGVLALADNTSGSNNTANGWAALTNNTLGLNNTASGVQALFNNTNALGNSAFGFQALLNNTSGLYNTAVGIQAGNNLTTGSGNVYIGAFQSAGAVNESNTTRIRNIATSPLNTGMFLEVDANGKIGFVTSSRRYKHDIEPMGDASEALYALEPVTFRYNGDIDPGHVKMFGLIAEDVAEVSPDLAVRNAKGEVIAIRFDSLNAMLLNEFLKEHNTVQEQGATIAELKKEIAGLATTVKEQAAQIQKVSAQLEVNKTVPQIVLNNQ